MTESTRATINAYWPVIMAACCLVFNCGFWFAAVRENSENYDRINARLDLIEARLWDKYVDYPQEEYVNIPINVHNKKLDRFKNIFLLNFNDIFKPIQNKGLASSLKHSPIMYIMLN